MLDFGFLASLQAVLVEMSAAQQASSGSDTASIS
jgi:hypothetical protein